MGKRGRGPAAGEQDEAPAAARLHQPARLSGHEQRPEQIDANRLQPLRRLDLRDGTDRAVHAGAVNDAVQTAELRDRRLEHCLDLLLHRDIRDAGDDLRESLLLEAPERLGQSLLRSRADQHLRACLQTCLGAGQTDPHAAARDCDPFSGQIPFTLHA